MKELDEVNVVFEFDEWDDLIVDEGCVRLGDQTSEIVTLNRAFDEGPHNFDR